MNTAPGPLAAEAAYVTPAFVTLVGLTMVLVTMFANVVVVHYATGVMQSAAEEAARQGVAVRTEAGCAGRARQALDAGLGSLAAEVETVMCSVSPQGATVEMTAVFAPWVPGLPDRHALISAAVRAEVTE